MATVEVFAVATRRCRGRRVLRHGGAAQLSAL
jgi:hypothetical protein